MKQPILTLAATAALLACGGIASAQTIFNGGSTGTATNWTNGLPTSVANPGSIAVDGSLANMSGYFVTQTAGTLTATGSRTFSNGTYNMTGGSMPLGTNNIILSGTQSFTLAGGTIQTADLNVASTSSFIFSSGTYTTSDDTVIGGTFTMSGGTFNSADLFSFNNGTAAATLTITGGTINAANFGNISTSLDGGATLNLNGGTIVATGSFGLYGDTNDNSVTFGGTNLGSITAASLVGGAGQYTLNWLTGTKMSMNITGSANWAETEYNAGRLLFNGQNNAALGLTWTQATSGGTQIWDFTGTTLSVIPEPSTWALLAVGLTTMVVFRRRRTV